MVFGRFFLVFVTWDLHFVTGNLQIIAFILIINSDTFLSYFSICNKKIVLVNKRSLDHGHCIGGSAMAAMLKLLEKA